MKNLLAALLCSVLLHAALATLLSLTESPSGKKIRVAAFGDRPAPPRIHLRLVSAAVETAAAAPVGPTAPLGKAFAKPKKHARPSAPPAPLAAAPASAPVPAPVASGDVSTEAPGVEDPASQPTAEAIAYFPSSELTTSPEPLNELVLGETDMSFLAAAGKIVLTLWVDDVGEVAEVAVETPDIPDEIAGGIIAAFKQLRFTAGELGERKVGVVMRIEVGVN